MLFFLLLKADSVANMHQINVIAFSHSHNIEFSHQAQHIDSFYTLIEGLHPYPVSRWVAQS